MANVTWMSEQIQRLLGKEFRTGDGRVWRVTTISGPGRQHVANFRHIATDVAADRNWIEDVSKSELQKVRVGILIDAWHNGLIEEV